MEASNDHVTAHVKRKKIVCIGVQRGTVRFLHGGCFLRQLPFRKIRGRVRRPRVQPVCGGVVCALHGLERLHELRRWPIQVNHGREKGVRQVRGGQVRGGGRGRELLGLRRGLLSGQHGRRVVPGLRGR
jgi:hypothetical protein